MPGTTRELRNRNDFPLHPNPDGSEVLPAVTTAGAPVGIPAYALFRNRGDVSYIKSSLTALQAIQGVQDGDYGLVRNDLPESGYYVFSGGTWVKEAEAPAIIGNYSEERIFYVAQDGDDSRNGEGRDRAVRSIEAARDLVANSSDPAAIYVYPGIYETSGHIDMPDNMSGLVSATNSRSTKIVPSAGNETKNVLRLGDGGYVEGFSFEGWRVDSLTDPNEGFAISFRPGAIIRRTVFAFNITVYRGQPATLITPPISPIDNREEGNPLVGNGPGVALADKAIVSQYSVFPQIMLWGATPVSPNGIGYCAKNGAFINGINAVALWMHKHYMALNGGEIILTNCASQFGDFSIWSEGFTYEVVPATTDVQLVVDAATADAIVVNKQSIIDSMWDALIAEYEAPPEFNTRKDAEIFLQAMEYDLRVGEQESIRQFARGLFDYKGDFVASELLIEEFKFSFDHMGASIKSLAPTGTHAMIDALVALVKNTLDAPERRIKPSKVTSVSHQWNNTMGGVNARGLYNPSVDVPQSIVQRNLGEVTFSGIDDKGKQYLSGGAIVNPLTGKLEGPPIGRTIDPRARRAAIIAGGQQ